MPAVSSSPTLTVVDDSDPLVGELADVPAAPAGLLQTLQRVPDPRKPRGVRHRLTTVLAVALGATLAGAQSFVAILNLITTYFGLPARSRDSAGFQCAPPMP